MELEGGVNFKCYSSSPSSMISPKSPPPGSVDVYGRRRQMVRVQSLEREIALLQDELNSMEGVQVASRCCKELDDYIRVNSDPLILPLGHQEASCVSHQWWKRLRRKFCCEVPNMCCFTGCSCCHRRGSHGPCLCHGQGCLPKTAQGSCYCCLRPISPSRAFKCESTSSCCKCKTCFHSCCL